MVVDLFDRPFAHLNAHLGIAVVILLTGVIFLGHRREQALIGGAGLRIEPAGNGKDDVVGVEVVAIVPLDPLTEIEGPRRQIVGRLPAFGQVGTGDVVWPGIGQKLAEMPGNIRLFHPVERGGISHLLHWHRTAQHATHFRFGILRKGRFR